MEPTKLSTMEQHGIKLSSIDKIPAYLRCAHCSGIVVDPQELSCCHALSCAVCISTKSILCPKCKKPFDSKEAVIPKRMINEQKAKCAFNCGFESSVSEVRAHAVKCGEREFHCAVPGCDFKSKKGLFIEHLKGIHTKVLISSLRNKETESGPDDVIGDRENSKGFVAKIGSSGKYYCGQALDVVECKCCNGECGPESGCNCSACMKLDLAARKLPKGFLVNGDGAIAQLQPGTEIYICGRKLMSSSDLRCSLKKMCKACSNLNICIKRYSAD